MLFKATIILLVSVFFTEIFATSTVEQEISSTVRQWKRDLEQKTNSKYEILLGKTVEYILENPEIEIICQARVARKNAVVPRKRDRIQIFLAYYESQPHLLMALEEQIDAKLQKSLENRNHEAIHTILKLKLYKNVLKTARDIATMQKYWKYVKMAENNEF